MLHYAVIGRKAQEYFNAYNRLTDFKNQHTWRAVLVAVGLLSVLSHYLYIHVVFNLLLRIY